MEQLKVCRICLITDVKMYNLQLSPLVTYFEPIIGLNPLSTMELPPYACYECATLLKKYYKFRERCLIGQSVLYGMLQTTGQITSQDIKQVDRQELNLASPLAKSNISTTNPKAYTNDNSELIKNEPDDIKDSTESMSVKNEDSCDVPFDNIVSSDDDEPLSLHKSMKEKEKKKGKSGRKKKEDVVEITDNVIPFPQELSTEPECTEIQTPAVPVKKKRGRPKKTDVPKTVAKKEEKKKSRRTTNTGGVSEDDNSVDLEDYATVVKLTFEEQLEEIKKREQSSNYQNAPFQCSLCYKGFIDTRAWEHHVGKHDPSAGDIECPICKFRFKTKRKLQKHAANHEKKYACKSCSYVSKTTTQAKQHHRWHKGVTFKCQFCDEISTKWTSYLSHVRIKHPSEFICGVCGYSFVSKLGLAMHRTMMHKDLEKTESVEGLETGPYCQECDVKFVSVEAYKRHMVISAKHVKNNDFKGCKVCGETFKNQEELRVHHRKEHARKRPKNYGKKPSNMTWPANCEHCSEVIPNAREFWVHFRRVHPDKSYPIQKNYVCDICGKSFRGNAFLVYHRRTHFEERAYKCTLCPKAFFNRTNLQMHEKVHSESRPYPCDICLKAFKCKGALDRHYRSHTGVKPYECEVCGKAFGQSNSRKLHVRTVHLRQPAPYLSKNRLERRRQNPPPPNTTNNPYFLY
ncbi:zinc finger protein 3 homolog [Hyposmocoma kahamanoa]|uniref:zinc finger protein 3 homolog n=1 Tax=Hyposmocoma kahamanoa TaxID=1477025 RepID=UPI000E6D75CA|nr:zinc finger protein 3 homolog [Hyposmocoma kahamanoa]